MMSVYLEYYSSFVQMRKLCGSDANAVGDIFQYRSFFNLSLRWFLTGDYFSKVKVNSVPNKPPADNKKISQISTIQPIKAFILKEQSLFDDVILISRVSLCHQLKLSQHARQATPT